jgi:predicted permease
MLPESLTRRYRRFWGPDPRRDVNEELAFHIEMRIQELQREGMTEAEAREATMKRFGSLADVRDECEELSEERVRINRRADRLDAARQDIHFAFRTFAANRGFAIVAALTMAIGLGANAAVFSVAYGVLLRPLPYRDVDALVRLWSRNDSRGLEFFSVSPADFKDWQASSRAFTAMAAFERQRDASLVRSSASGTPEAVQVTAVMPEMFPLLGAPAFRGRTLLPDDARPEAPSVAVVSHDLWSARFGSDPALVGSHVSLDGASVTIVGVMPPRFSIPGTPAQVWTPMSLASAPDDHGNRFLRVLARLTAGVTPERGLADVDAVAVRLGRDYPGTNGPWTVSMMPVREMLVGRQFRRSVLVLVGVVTFVLIIACANVANLQLARAAARQREIALRAALGATRGRITRQLLTESVVLAVVAGCAGLALGYGALVLLRHVGDRTVPRLEDVRMDAPVLAFMTLVTLGSGVLFGLLPAFRASRPDPGEALKTGGRGTGAGAAGQGLRSALVVAEISLSLVLLVGAALLGRSFIRLQGVELGFDPRGVSIAPIALPPALYPDREKATAYFQAVIDRVRRLRGVTSVGAVSSAPFAGANSGLVYVRTDRPVDARERAPDADYRAVTPGYFRALGIRLIAGRDFSDQDREGAPAAIIVSEALARAAWPGESALGRELRIGDIVKGPVFAVVGVVSDARYQTLETPDIHPMMYFSALARPQSALMIIARTNATAQFAAGLQEAMASVDSRIPPPTVMPMPQLLSEVVATRRFALVLLGIFGGTALVLAAVGIYGVMAYLVRQTLPEIGVRIALGAPPRALVQAIVGRAVKLGVMGVAVGLAGAWGLTRLLSVLLFEVEATDRATFAAVAVLLVVVAAAASLIPARRATKADPLVVLRGNG